MGRFYLALRAFWAALTNHQLAQQLEAALAAAPLPKGNVDEKPQRPPQVAAASPIRSEAITLLAALQREARLVDLLKQPLANFSDEEVGAAARTVLTDSAKVVERFFAVQPLAAEPEGAPCQVPAAYDAACFKLSGRVEGTGPFRGTVVHHGWKATSVHLPAWTGSKDAALVIAPAEVEIS